MGVRVELSPLSAACTCGDRGGCSQSLTHLHRSRRSSPCHSRLSVCVGLLLSVTSGAASLFGLHRKFPHSWGPTAPFSLSAIQASPWVSCGNSCRLQSHFLIQLLHIHPVHHLVSGGCGRQALVGTEEFGKYQLAITTRAVVTFFPSGYSPTTT